MTKLIQRTKFNPDAGQFLLRINSQIASVTKEVTEQLKIEYSNDATFQHLVWLESHPEHSVLVVTPRRLSDKQYLMTDTGESAEHYLKRALRRRSFSRAS